jgi:hypothetical protein
MLTLAERVEAGSNAMERENLSAESTLLAARTSEHNKQESQACDADPLNVEKYDLCMAELLQQTEAGTQVIDAVSRLRE